MTPLAPRPPRSGLIRLLRGDRDADRLVPRGVQSSRSVGIAAAILTFFAALALALALAAGRLADHWQGDLADTATLQILADAADMEAQARAALEVLRTTPGVEEVRMIDLSEQRALLEPWLGTGVTLDNLDLPLMIEVHVDRATLNRQGLELRLAAEVPGAIYDDHTTWRAPLVLTAGRLKLFALASLGLIAVVFAAMLGLAANAAIAASGTAIQTLRLVGARDSYITGAFVRRFSRTAFWGAVAGTAAALGLIALLPPASEPGFFLVGIGLSGWGWGAALLLPLGAAIVAWAATRGAIRRQLRRWS